LRMGRNAREVVETLFSEETMVARYEQLLLELCGMRAAAGEAAVS